MLSGLSRGGIIRSASLTIVSTSLSLTKGRMETTSRCLAPASSTLVLMNRLLPRYLVSSDILSRALGTDHDQHSKQRSGTSLTLQCFSQIHHRVSLTAL